MKRFVCAFGLMAIVVGMAAVLGSQAGAQDEKELPSISAIMKKMHGKAGALPKVKADLAASPVDWAVVKKSSTPLVRLSMALGKNEAPKGEQADFETKSKDYNAIAKGLVAAAETEDLAAAQEATGKLSASCGGCHSAHKP